MGRGKAAVRQENGTTRCGKAPRHAFAQGALVLPHLILQVLFGHRHPGNRDRAPMGAHSNAENLEPAILGLRIRPIQREIHARGGPNDRRHQVANGDLHINTGVGQEAVDPLNRMLGGGGAGHGETAANRRNAENRMAHQRPDQGRQRVPLRFAQGSVGRKVFCERRQLEQDGPPPRGLLLPTPSTEGPPIPLREYSAYLPNKTGDGSGRDLGI